jgi:hypothetical protein
LGSGGIAALLAFEQGRSGKGALRHAGAERSGPLFADVLASRRSDGSRTEL